VAAAAWAQQLQAAEAAAAREGAEGAARVSTVLASLREAEAEAQALTRRGEAAEAEAARLQQQRAAAATAATPAGVEREGVEQAREGRVAAEFAAAEAEAEATRLQKELLSAHHALLTQHKAQLQQRELVALWRARCRGEKLDAAERKQRERQEVARQEEAGRARATTYRLAPAASEPRLSSAVEYARLGGGARALSLRDSPDTVLPHAQRPRPRPRPVSAGHRRMRVDVPYVWTDLVARRDPSPHVTTSARRLQRHNTS